MPSETLDPKKALKNARLIWGAMIVGLLIFGVVVCSGFSTPESGGFADETLYYIAWIMAVFAPMLGIFIRGQVFKAGWVGDVVKPESYLTGNIMAWAMCEASAFFSLVVVMLAGKPTPYIFPALVSLVMLILFYPNGKAMFPRGADDQHKVSER